MNDMKIHFGADPNLVQAAEGLLAQVRSGAVYIGCDILKNSLMAGFTGQASRIVRQ